MIWAHEKDNKEWEDEKGKVGCQYESPKSKSYLSSVVVTALQSATVTAYNGVVFRIQNDLS